MFSFGRILVKGGHVSYTLKDKVEQLFYFLSRYGSQLTNIDPVHFLVREYINGTYQLPKESNVHVVFYRENGCSDPKELPAIYRKLYNHLENIFAGNRSEIKEAMPYLIEKTTALAFEKLQRGDALCNCKFFWVDSKRQQVIKGPTYVNSNLKPSNHEEVDVVADARRVSGSGILTECKSSVGGFRSCLQDVSDFLEHLQDEIFKESKATMDIVYVFPSDKNKRFKELISKTTRKKASFSMELVNWKTGISDYHP